MSKDLRFNKKEHGFDDDSDADSSDDESKPQKPKKFIDIPKPKSNFVRSDKRASDKESKESKERKE